MAPPKQPEHERRKRTLSIHLTDEELAALKRAAALAGEAPAAMARKMIMSCVVPAIEAADELEADRGPQWKIDMGLV